MLISYKINIGMEIKICDKISGGVITADNTKVAIKE